MALYALLEIEAAVQVGDKTRLSGAKCFVSGASATALSDIKITPGLDGSQLSVWDADVIENRYLDHIFTSWSVDIITGINDRIDFKQGSTLYVATLTQGTYTLATLKTEIASKLNAAGASGTFSIASDEKDQLTITNDTTQTEYLPVGVNRQRSLLPHIGFPKIWAGVLTSFIGLSVIGRPVEYGFKKISVEATATITATQDKYIKLYSVLGDNLFTSDGDLQPWESDILNYVGQGRSSFLREHRMAQEQILQWFDKEGFTNVYGNKFTKWDILDVNEVKEMSMFLTLSIIMWQISNKKDDIWFDKYIKYDSRYKEVRKRVVRIDTNKDGQQDLGEQVSFVGGTLVLR